jgi:helix-turn-helix resolvase-like protein
MPDRPKINVRLAPELHAVLMAHVHQGHRLADVIRDALEAHLGVRPTAPRLAGGLSDMSARLERLAAAVADLQRRLGQLEARSPGVGPSPIERPTAPLLERLPGGQRKLSPRQIKALRTRRDRGASIKTLMEEFGISKATLFRYLAAH